jgi:hypothetical protein
VRHLARSAEASGAQILSGRAADVRLYRLTAEILAAVEADVFPRVSAPKSSPPSLQASCQD